MRLFYALFRRKHMPNGHIYRGKDRIVKAVSLADVTKLKNAWEIEEQNMFYLRHSYLTPEQSFGHSQALGKGKARIDAFNQAKTEFKDNVTIEARLGHLRHKEAWD